MNDQEMNYKCSYKECSYIQSDGFCSCGTGFKGCLAFPVKVARPERILTRECGRCENMFDCPGKTKRDTLCVLFKERIPQKRRYILGIPSDHTN